MQKGKVRVELHKDCIDFGGKEEYPHMWCGWLQYVTVERLGYVTFGGPFLVKGKDKKLHRKTDDKNGMLIPEWLLVSVQ